VLSKGTMLKKRSTAMGAFTMSNSVAGKALHRDDLFRAGRSLKLLALAVIILLSIGILVLCLTQWVESGQLQEMLRTDSRSIYGFGLLMLLTVGYLVGKGWSTTKLQQTMIAELLDEESISRARR